MLLLPDGWCFVRRAAPSSHQQHTLWYSSSMHSSHETLSGPRRPALEEETSPCKGDNTAGTADEFPLRGRAPAGNFQLRLFCWIFSNGLSLFD